MALAAGGLGGGGPGGSCGAAGCSGGACMGPWDVLVLDAVERKVGVLVRGGTGAGCFPLDTGGVGSELACTGAVVWDVPACMVGLAGRLMFCSF